MVKSITFLAALIACGAVVLGGADATRVRMEQDVTTHDGTTSSWVKTARVPADKDVSFTVQLKVDQEALNELERVFWEVSDPKHKNYGKHKSVDEITEILGVPAERVDKVEAFFKVSGGKTEVHKNRDSIKVTMPAAKAEAALDTEFHTFTHKERSQVSVVRSATGYSLPESIARCVKGGKRPS